MCESRKHGLNFVYSQATDIVEDFHHLIFVEVGSLQAEDVKELVSRHDTEVARVVLFVSSFGSKFQALKHVAVLCNQYRSTIIEIFDTY